MLGIFEKELDQVALMQELRNNERLVLTALMAQPGQIVPSSQLLSLLGYTAGSRTGVLKVHICNIRKKLSFAAGTIVNKPRKGYMWKKPLS